MGMAEPSHPLRFALDALAALDVLGVEAEHRISQVANARPIENRCGLVDLIEELVDPILDPFTRHGVGMIARRFISDRRCQAIPDAHQLDRLPRPVSLSIA